MQARFRSMAQGQGDETAWKLGSPSALTFSRMSWAKNMSVSERPGQSGESAFLVSAPPPFLRGARKRWQRAQAMTDG